MSLVEVQPSVPLGRRELYVAGLRAEWRLAAHALEQAEIEYDAIRLTDIANTQRVQNAAQRVIQSRMVCATIRSKLEAADRWYWELSCAAT